METINSNETEKYLINYLDETNKKITIKSKHLVNNCIPDLSNIEELSNINILYIDSCEIKGVISDNFFPNHIKHFEIFNSIIDYDVFKHLPNTITNIVIKNTKINVDVNISTLINIEILTISNTKLKYSSLLESLNPTNKLSVYLSYLHTDKLPTLPNNVNKLSIVKVTFSDKHFPYKLGSYCFPDNLEMLKLNELKLTKIPKHVFKLHNLKYLCLCENNIETHSLTGINKLTKLESLYLDLNNINTIRILPESLIRFSADHNKIKSIDCFPKNLKEICLNYNNLLKIPALPSNLEILEINDNRLKELPPVLPKPLKELHISNNKLTSLPDCIYEENSIIEMSAFCNDINYKKDLPFCEH